MGKKEPTTRRSILKKSAVASTAPFLFSKVGAETSKGDKFDAHIKHAFSLERKYGSEAVVEYMREKGYYAVNKPIEFEISMGDSGPTINQVEDPKGEGIKGDMMGVYDEFRDEYLISLGIDYKFDVEVTKNGWTGYCNVYPNSYGSDPIDAAGLAWNSPNSEPGWEVISEDAFSDFAFTYGEHVDWEDGTYKPNTALGYTFDDEEVYWDWIEDSFQEDNGECKNMGEHEEYVYAGRAGVKLKPVGNMNESDRAVYGGYTHGWETTNNDISYNLGVTGGSGGGGVSVGVTINPETEVEQASTQTEEDGDTLLKITQSEIYDGGGGCC